MRLLVAVLLAAFSQLVLAQAAWPAKPVRWVVPFPPGGATVIVARLVAAKMGEVWGQSVLVENRAGAGTVVGTDFVAKSPPDGYTMGVVITAHVINPSLRTNMPYDTVKDLAGVAQIAQAHMVIAAHPSFEANNLAELIALAKKNPGKIAYATPGSGTAMHLTVELLKATAGIDLVHVPYKGGAPATQDVLGGRVPLLLDLHFSASPHLRAGKLKTLAMLSPQRPPAHADIPVISETVPGVSAVSIYGLVVPSATPRDIVQKASADIARAMRSPDVVEKMAQQGIEALATTPEQWDALIRSEIARWAPVVKASGAKAD
jgi:tripartite-type tricarboxylate transporter receptor subunit TctC